ncbi:MAG: peptidase S10, partial [Acidimicrobiia bacterium]|nr:peptidase S10 [Acidimicrobiia bacterium]
MSEPKPETKEAAHSVPEPAEHSAAWGDLAYTVRSEWIVLREKEKPVAEIFSTAYVADDGGEGRPITFVFNGGPGAASAYLHVGAIGPRRIDFPRNGTLPAPPAQLVDNAESWLAFTDLVFVDPVGTGFSRIIESQDEQTKDGKPEKKDPTAFFGLKR